jgi:hypothetical protein
MPEMETKLDKILSGPDWKIYNMGRKEVTKQWETNMRILFRWPGTNRQPPMSRKL